MAKERKQFGSAISWERARAIFGDAKPPKNVWERQFDYCDDDLRRVAATPYREIVPSDLWYYFHDMAYVELQPDLFNYLFPVCLMRWHDTLMRNEPCSQGDSEFHYGLFQGDVFQKMVTPRQLTEVVAFFQDSFLQRLDVEPVTIIPSMLTDPFSWIYRFNSLGFVVPQIEAIWEPWWEMATRGRAVAAIKYCSGLVYFMGENRSFGIEARTQGWVGPYLWANDSLIVFSRTGWTEGNVSFLRDALTYDYILRKLDAAATRLQGEPEHEVAISIRDTAVSNRELVESRLAELPDLLAGNGKHGIEGWSV